MASTIAATDPLLYVPTALAQMAPVTTAETSKVQVNDKGMPLYICDRDAGKSNCNGQCAANWTPPKAAVQDVGRPVDRHPPRR